MPPEELQLEIDTLKTLDHPHIIRLFEYFEDYNNIYIIMEAAKGGELLDVIDSNYKAGYRLNEQWIAVVFEQSLSAIAYVHARGRVGVGAESVLVIIGSCLCSLPEMILCPLFWEKLVVSRAWRTGGSYG